MGNDISAMKNNYVHKIIVCLLAIFIMTSCSASKKDEQPETTQNATDLVTNQPYEESETLQTEWGTEETDSPSDAQDNITDPTIATEDAEVDVTQTPPPATTAPIPPIETTPSVETAPPIETTPPIETDPPIETSPPIETTPPTNPPALDGGILEGGEDEDRQ